MNSADCRDNATACIVMANRAANREEWALFELARSWMKHAAELERDPDLSDAVKDVRTFARHH